MLGGAIGMVEVRKFGSSEGREEIWSWWFGVGSGWKSWGTREVDASWRRG